ncbi:CDK-activating kinase assembly factor MAT1 [Nematocida sp. ERTm5]|nr:CDK-activating kinase assembly factor MAT1 [Nematocida sp. ERTm5]
MESIELFCPQCKSNSYINPGMKIFVSPCYHSLCELCVSRLFANGPNQCPECNITLRRSNYMSQTFEDVSIERECRIRKIIASQIGKSLEDYSDEEDYNDYLEQVEQMVLELSTLKAPKEVLTRVQEIKEELEKEKSSDTESVKKRKIDLSVSQEVTSTCKVSIKYLFPPEAIDHLTIPKRVIASSVLSNFNNFKSLTEILIQKASASLTTPTL